MNFERGAPVLMAEWFKGVTWNVEFFIDYKEYTVKVLLSEPFPRSDCLYRIGHCN